MGLLNVIKLANDYQNAKKLLKKNSAKVKDIENAILKVQEFIIELKDFGDKIKSLTNRAKDLISELSERIPKGKEG